MEKYSNQKNKSVLFQTNNKKAFYLLIAIFLVTAYYRLFLSLPLLLLIFFVKRESKIAKVLAIPYAIFVTVVNISVYAAQGYNEQGVFDSSGVPIYIFLGILIAFLVYLTRSFKEKSTMVESDNMQTQ